MPGGEVGGRRVRCMRDSSSRRPEDDVSTMPSPCVAACVPLPTKRCARLGEGESRERGPICEVCPPVLPRECLLHVTVTCFLFAKNKDGRSLGRICYTSADLTLGFRYVSFSCRKGAVGLHGFR